MVLPVDVDGAFLYFGDVKARMADGELAQSPEVQTRITAVAEVRPPPASMSWPRIEREDILAVQARLSPAWMPKASGLC